MYYIESPIGVLGISADEGGISRICIANEPPSSCPLPEPVAAAAKQLGEYFKGERRKFKLPLAPKGTPFQRAVWDELLKIPYGSTASYGEIAARVGNPKAARAVGMANNKNPIMIVIPCHRVVGSDGSLTGYAGGLEAKAWLLRLEQTSK